MALVSEISSNSNAGAASTAQLAGVLGKDDFLRLLVAQLEHQDPLNPADPTEFTAQLAQFSSLEQLFNVNDNLADLASANSEMERLTALSMIGKEIIHQGGDFSLGEEAIDLGYRLEQSASEVTLYIRDQHGKTVATLEADQLGAGNHFLSWNGLDDVGQKVPAGSYNLFVSALAGEDQAIEAIPLISGRVTGVDLDQAGDILLTNAGDFRLNDITSVRNL